MQFALERIQEVLDIKGYQFFDDGKPFTVNIIGVRSEQLIANSFDDWLYLIYKDENGAAQIHEFPITTDPGTYWLQHPMNVNGTAIVVPGQYINIYEVGLHQGKYEALKQKRPIKIWRDNTKDNKIDQGGTIYEGVFGINIHRSNAKTASTVVEKWSAGCQVFKKASDFNFFMEICKKSTHKQYSYTLLEESDFSH